MSAAKRGNAKNDKAAAKRQAPTISGPTRRGLKMFALLTVAGSLAGGGYAIWRYVGPDVLAHSDYQLSPEGITITPPPSWIRTDLKRQVLESGGLEGPLSLLDADLNQRVAAAFELHPWVAEVLRVEKSQPARVDVTLRYRKPVAMAEVPGGLYAVDEEGVLLPSEDFSPIEASRYPRLSSIRSAPLGPVGTPWGDSRVAGAARIAEALFDDWDKLELARIIPAAIGDSAPNNAAENYEIYTRRGARILWGAPPAGDLFDDDVTSAKRARLSAEFAEREPAGAPREIDLRSLDAPASEPRTATRPASE